jgi:signal transduction histidine kinase
VEDNGSGIPKDVLKSGDGMGLKTIKERVKYLNGQIDIASSPGEGTCIYIELGIIAVKQNIATT